MTTSSSTADLISSTIFSAGQLFESVWPIVYVFLGGLAAITAIMLIIWGVKQFKKIK